MEEKVKFPIYSPESIVSEIANSEVINKAKLKSTEKEEKDFKNQFRLKVGEEHPFDYTLVEGICKKFGMVNSVVDKISDFTIGPGLNIESDDEEIITIIDEWNEQTQFKSYLRPWFKQGLQKGSSYFEIAGLTNPNVMNVVKVINSNSVYVQRDKFGETKAFNQYFGNEKMGGVRDEDIKQLPINDIIQLNINEINSSAYGMGIVYSALQTIDYFLSAQKAMHKIMTRKSNSQIHVKMGNVEKDDYPSQSDIDAFGKKLQYMQETTEWVTGPNVEMKILDFGNIGEKFDTVLSNDYKLLSYCFQVPEVLLGAGNVPEGLAQVQLDSFERNIKSYQDQIAHIIKTEIYDKVLEAKGIVEKNYTIIWGEKNDEQKLKELSALKEILGVMNLSIGMQEKIEEKIAQLLDIDYDEVAIKNEENEAKEEARQEEERKMQMQQQKPFPIAKKEHVHNHSDECIYCKIEEKVMRGEAPQEIEAELEKSNINTMGIDIYNEALKVADEIVENYPLEEWVGEYYQIKPNIMKVIEEDRFEELRAKDRKELSLGKLSKRQTEELRIIFKEAFEERKGLREIADRIRELGIKDRYVLDENGEKRLVISKEYRPYAIARSESVRLRAVGSLETFKEKGEDKVKFTLVSSKPCSECEALDGKVYTINEAYGVIPLHTNCRCKWDNIPIQESSSEYVKEEGWVTVDGRHIYIGKDGKMYTGKDAIDASKKNNGDKKDGKDKFKTYSDITKTHEVDMDRLKSQSTEIDVDGNKIRIGKGYGYSKKGKSSYDNIENMKGKIVVGPEEWIGKDVLDIPEIKDAIDREYRKSLILNPDGNFKNAKYIEENNLISNNLYRYKTDMTYSQGKEELELFSEAYFKNDKISSKSYKDTEADYQEALKYLKGQGYSDNDESIKWIEQEHISQKLNTIDNYKYEKTKFSQEAVNQFASEVERTQKVLKEKYPEGKVTLYRGVVGDYSKDIEKGLKSKDEYVVKIDAITSWTSDEKVAESFAKNIGRTKGVVIKKEFDTKDVLFTYHNSPYVNTKDYIMGGKEEYEFIIGSKTKELKLKGEDVKRNA